jgi:hypothetical protein
MGRRGRYISTGHFGFRTRRRPRVAPAADAIDLDSVALGGEAVVAQVDEPAANEAGAPFFNGSAAAATCFIDARSVPGKARSRHPACRSHGGCPSVGVALIWPARVGCRSSGRRRRGLADRAGGDRAIAAVRQRRPRHARARGVPLRLVSAAFLILLGIAADASQITGSLLVFGLLVAPAAAASRLTARPVAGLTLSVLIAVMVTWLGEGIAFFSPYPIGFWVTTLAFAVFLLASGYRALADRLARYATTVPFTAVGSPA